MSHDSMSNVTNTLRTMYDYRTAKALYPNSDPYATVWELKNLKVTDAVVAHGSARIGDGEISVNAELRTSTDSADVTLAVYDEEGRLIDGTFANIADGEGSFEMSSEYEKGYKTRLFIWDASKNQAPMIPQIELIR